MNWASVPWFALCAEAARLFRFGPTLPVVPAGLKRWQAPQPLEMKTGRPADALPFGPSVGSLPITVSGVGVVTFFPPGTVLEQPTRNVASSADCRELPHGERV